MFAEPRCFGAKFFRLSMMIPHLLNAQSINGMFFTKCQTGKPCYVRKLFLKSIPVFSFCGSEKFFFCRNKKKEKDRSRSRSRRRSRSRSRSRSGSRDKKKKKRKDRSRSRSGGGGDNKRKERDEAEKEAGEVHSDGERKKVRVRPSLPFWIEDGFTLISRMLKTFCRNNFLSGGVNFVPLVADQN
jgi:hypothetical protein